MAIFSLSPSNCFLSSHSLNIHFHPASNSSTRGAIARFAVLSAHSNPKILKSNRHSKFGQRLSPYDTDGESEDEYAAAADDYGDDEDDDWLLNDSKPGSASSRLRSRAEINGNGGSMYMRRTFNQKNLRRTLGSKGKDKDPVESVRCRYRRLAELDERWYPLLDYLTTFGLKESHLLRIYNRHMPSLKTNVTSAQQRLDFLLSVGVKTKDVKKILTKHPQILQCTVESNLKSHVAFLTSLGIPESRIGQVITHVPSLFSYSVENSLKPTVRYLLEEVGINKSDLSKVVQLSPQILVRRLDNSWNARCVFLTRELGAPVEDIVKMVTKHPQLLHYSIEDGLLPRINFLRSIGMSNADILKLSTSLTQVFSLSVEGNLKPKYKYLVNELRNEVKSLTKYPTYLSLSLDQRIRPRHRFLVSLKKAPKGPFPLGSFLPTDESFCQQWAETSLDTYLTFRQELLLKDLVKKYTRSKF